VPGEKAGTGICEVCHVSTSVYNSAGTGADHHKDFCMNCHSHQDGFLHITTKAWVK
jgi:hypothetical protein